MDIVIYMLSHGENFVACRGQTALDLLHLLGDSMISTVLQGHYKVGERLKKHFHGNYLAYEGV